LKNITTTNIQNSTLDSSFDALLKCHDLDIREEPVLKFRYCEKATKILDVTNFTKREIFKKCGLLKISEL
jgi:hypothetical protein